MSIYDEIIEGTRKRTAKIPTAKGSIFNEVVEGANAIKEARRLEEIRTRTRGIVPRATADIKTSLTSAAVHGKITDYVREKINKTGKERQALSELARSAAKDNRDISASRNEVLSRIDSDPELSRDVGTYYELSRGKSSFSPYEANARQKAKDKLTNAGYDADALLEIYSQRQDKLEMNKTVDSAKEFAKRGPIHASALSVVSNIASVGGLWADDENSIWAVPSRVTEALREGVNEKIDNPIGSFFYNTGMSAVDNIIRVPLGVTGAALMGMGASGSAAVDVLERGGSRRQAIATGILAGGAEFIFEKIGLSNFKKLKDSAGVGFKSAAGNIMKGMLREGLEEVETDLVNAVSDRLVNGGYSEFEIKMREYMGEGKMSEAEAYARCAKEFGIQLASTFASAMLIGAATGTVSQIKGRKEKNTAEKLADAVEESPAETKKASAKEETAEGEGESASPAIPESAAPSVRYSISETEDGREFVELDRDILEGVPRSDWEKTVRANLKAKFPDGITVGNNQIKINQQSRREMTYSKYMQWLNDADPNVAADKLRATDNADEIIKAADNWVNEGLNHPRKDKIQSFARGNILIRVGNKDYTADVVVGTESDGAMLLYDVLNLKSTNFTKKEMSDAISPNPSPGVARNTSDISEDIISENAPSVNSPAENVTQMQHKAPRTGLDDFNEYDAYIERELAPFEVSDMREARLATLRKDDRYSLYERAKAASNNTERSGIMTGASERGRLHRQAKIAARSA